jgi:hypothetical protein
LPLFVALAHHASDWRRETESDATVTNAALRITL